MLVCGIFLVEWACSVAHGSPRRACGCRPNPPLPRSPSWRSHRRLLDSPACCRPLRARSRRQAAAGQGRRPERARPQRLHAPTHRLQEESHQNGRAAAETRSKYDRSFSLLWFLFILHITFFLYWFVTENPNKELEKVWWNSKVCKQT